MLSKERINKTIQEDKPYIDALLEYERTGKLKKVSYKERLDITLDEGVLKALKSYCKERNIKVSNLIEQLIKKELKF